MANHGPKTQSFLKSILGAIIFVIVIAWLIPILINHPTEEVTRQEQKELNKWVVAQQDPLLAGIEVQFAKVESPPVKQLVSPALKKPLKQAVAETKKKKILESVAVQMQKKQVQHLEQVKTITTVTVKPTKRLLAKGKALLESPLGMNKELPQITGDYSKIGFHTYADALTKSGGKLVVYDWSGQYGRLPLIELDGVTYVPRLKNLANYYLERPRLIQHPELKLSKALAELQKREYPKAELGAAFVLPKTAEYYILGAMKDVLKNSLYSFERLRGEYRQDRNGKLVFTVRSGVKHGEKRESSLPQKIIINFGYIS